MESKLSKVREIATDPFVDEIIDAGFVNEGSHMLWPPEQFEPCIIGADSEGRVVYSEQLVIQSFMKQGMSYEEAEEYFEYNTIRSCQYIPNEKRPLFIRVQRQTRFGS